MPWIKLGRFRFDLDQIELVAEAAGAERDHGGPGVTVTLRSGVAFDLSGDEALAFLAAFDAHTASREIGRSPPGPPAVIHADLILPEPAARNPG